jgi:hypothetical protein
MRWSKGATMCFKVAARHHHHRHSQLLCSGLTLCTAISKWGCAERHETTCSIPERPAAAPQVQVDDGVAGQLREALRGAQQVAAVAAASVARRRAHVPQVRAVLCEMWPRSDAGSGRRMQGLAQSAKPCRTCLKQALWLPRTRPHYSGCNYRLQHSPAVDRASMSRVCAPSVGSASKTVSVWNP